MAHRPANAHRRDRTRPVDDGARHRSCRRRSSPRRSACSRSSIPTPNAPPPAWPRELGLGMTLSTVSSVTLEDVAEENGDGVRWFQLYWPHDDGVCVSLLERAQAAGFTALRRHARHLDARLAPARPRQRLPAVPAAVSGWPTTSPTRRSAPDWTRRPTRTCAPRSMHWLPIFTGKDHTWDDLAFLREHWDGPIVLKGVQHPDDARRAVDAGMQGVLVSNHGGRQVDGAIGALDALPGIVDAVGDQARGAVRLRHPHRRRTSSRRSRSARGRCWSDGRGCTASASAARTACGTCCAACSPISTCRSRCRAIRARRGR